MKTSPAAALPAALDQVQELAVPALASALERLHPDLERVATYHLGWTDEQGRPSGGRGGKGLRPGLALLSARAAGAPAATGVPGAVAVELVHNFSLLHDDFMDGDGERRHRRTAWKVFGPGSAILAGDALLALAGDVLLERPAPEGPRAARHLTDATGRLIAGQAADLDFERRDDVTVADCLRMAGDKTGALLGCAASIGAVLAGARGTLVERLAEFGYRLGLAFQAVDDLLGIWGRPEVTGKPTWSDLRQRKKSVPVTVALASGGAAGERLAALLARERLDGEEDLALAAKLVEDAGGRDWARAAADRQLDLALACLDDAGVPDGARDDLAAVARFVTTRER